MRILTNWLYRDIDYNEEKELYEAWPVGYQIYNYWSDSFKKYINCPTKDQKSLWWVVWWKDYNNIIPKIDSISKSISDHTWPDFNEEYYWDYRDDIDDQTVVDFINKHMHEFETEEEALDAWHAYLEDKWDSWIIEATDDYYNEVFKDWKLDDEDPWNIQEYICDYLWIFYYKVNCDHFDSQDIDMHLYCLAPQELNYDLWPVWELASWYNDHEYKYIDFKDDCFNPDVCFVSWLTEQQWYRMKTLFSSRKTNSKYINSMRSELANFFHVCWATVILDRQEIGYWIKTLCVKDGHYDLSTSKHIGLFAPIVWWWSMFDIELDKDVSLHNKYISWVDSRRSKWKYWYTVEEVYGFTWDMYK